MRIMCPALKFFAEIRSEFFIVITDGLQSHLYIRPVLFPQYERGFWNLGLMSQSLNRRKGDTVGQRQMDLLRKLKP
jgi:hypothetical protein